MKKKILVAVFLALAACLLAFTVSAADEVTLLDGTRADFATVFKVNASNVVTGFNTGYDKNGVCDVTFPDEIVGIECNFLFGSSTTINTLTFAATDTFFISGDNIFSSCSVKKITFNPDCEVELRKGNFSGCKSLTEITFPKFKKLNGSAFHGCTNMASTNALVFAEGLTEIGGHAFHDCLALSGTVYFPSTLVKIQEYSFENTGFEYFDLSKCASLTAVGGGYGGPFTNNDKITTLDLSGCTSLTSLKGSFAADCDNLTEVILPPNLETIPHKAFAHCYKLQSMVFPASLTYVADEAFHSARRGQENMTFTVYIQSNVQFHATYPFRDSGAKIEYVLIGDGVTLESFLAVNTFASLVNATVVDYTENRDYAAGSVSTHTIVTNYCKSLALSGEHQFGSNPCVVVCSECLLATTKENPEHATVSSVLYENGFGAEGVKLVACTNEGCTYEESTVAKALLVCRGYSASQYGACGIVISYFVNYDAIEEYKNVMECDMEYGVFAVAKSNLGDNEVFGEDGVAAQGVISFKTSSYKFVAFELKLTGFETDAQKSTELAMGAYVAVTKGEATEYSYVQFGTPDEGEGYCFDSYNDVMEYLKAE